ncbi:GlcG/HbpS family heme-binding protein [Streptomyces luteolus]|uniref:Heme-binding protein n=1 Tax=Streptomyces luteolus TaxID=3043615 RepID=A0ABT6STU7_9ACTN|nr:heme-binding protein [Streptomyces sp. B-S-A12]MDI3418508.1 heme-binding protein [Streptomyces sp. B-S-A12]
MTSPTSTTTVTAVSLSLEQAVSRAEAGVAAARALDARMNIALVDAAGHLVHFSRMDGAWLGCIDWALKKAKTSALFCLPTAAVGELSQPGGPVYGIESTNGGLVTFAGGLPITDAEGTVIGAVGVSGGTTEQDAAVAEAAVKGEAEARTAKKTASPAKKESAPRTASATARTTKTTAAARTTAAAKKTAPKKRASQAKTRRPGRAA